MATLDRSESDLNDALRRKRMETYGHLSLLDKDISIFKERNKIYWYTMYIYYFQF